MDLKQHSDSIGTTSPSTILVEAALSPIKSIFGSALNSDKGETTGNSSGFQLTFSDSLSTEDVSWNENATMGIQHT